jgi:UDP-4-amino-4,6-dideoxy-N-acetyl-beta-L-altrosamine transaminase
LLYKLDFTGEENGISGKSKLEVPIPYSKHSVTQSDINAVTDCLQNKPITQGKMVTEFENKISTMVNSKGAVASNSATSSLHLACLALDVKSGDIVWTTPISFIASATAALMCGAKIDFVDVDAKTGNIDPELLEEKLNLAKEVNKLPKVLIVVHFSGRPCDMFAISSVCKKHNIKIIEDAAHSLGATQNGKLIGNCEFSEITVFSLHPAKIITSAEGGIATSQNVNLLERMKALSSHGIWRSIDPEEPWKYDMRELGYNYRMSDLHASLGLSQLKRIGDFLKIRKEIVLYYIDKLKSFPLRMPPYSVDSAWHLFVCHTETSKKRRSLLKFLNKSNINAGVHYRPIYQNTYFQKLGFKHTDFPNAENYYSNSISLPLYTDISIEQIDYIISKLKEFFGENYG